MPLHQGIDRSDAETSHARRRAVSLAGVAGMLEIVGGLLLLLGLFTRHVEFILSGEMAVAYFVAHGPQGDFFMPALNGGEEAGRFSAALLFSFSRRLAEEPGA